MFFLSTMACLLSFAFALAASFILFTEERPSTYAFLAQLYRLAIALSLGSIAIQMLRFVP